MGHANSIDFHHPSLFFVGKDRRVLHEVPPPPPPALPRREANRRRQRQTI